MKARLLRMMLRSVSANVYFIMRCAFGAHLDHAQIHWNCTRMHTYAHVSLTSFQERCPSFDKTESLWEFTESQKTKPHSITKLNLASADQRCARCLKKDAHTCDPMCCSVVAVLLQCCYSVLQCQTVLFYKEKK